MVKIKMHYDGTDSSDTMVPIRRYCHIMIKITTSKKPVGIRIFL